MFSELVTANILCSISKTNAEYSVTQKKYYIFTKYVKRGAFVRKVETNKKER